MATLKQRIIDLVDVTITKLNLLNTNKEDKSNKKTNLTSTDANHYPNVPAVKAGINTAITTANQYTDTQIGNLPDYIPLSQKGANNGVAELDAAGKVPTEQLPSYVDDVVDLVDFVTTNPSSGMTAGEKWYNTATQKIFTATGTTTGVDSDPEEDKVYVKVNDNQVYRWSGTIMVQLAGGLVLGTTSSTAHRGDHGAAAYNHISLTNNPHSVTKAQVGLSNVDNTSDINKPVSTAQAAAIAVVQDDLNDYRTNEVGTAFPDYAAQLTTGLNF